MRAFHRLSASPRSSPRSPGVGRRAGGRRRGGDQHGAKTPIAIRGPAAFESSMPKNRRASKVEDTFDQAWGKSFPTTTTQPSLFVARILSSSLQRRITPHTRATGLVRRIHHRLQKLGPYIASTSITQPRCLHNITPAPAQRSSEPHPTPWRARTCARRRKSSAISRSPRHTASPTTAPRSSSKSTERTVRASTPPAPPFRADSVQQHSLKIPRPRYGSWCSSSSRTSWSSSCSAPLPCPLSWRCSRRAMIGPPS